MKFYRLRVGIEQREENKGLWDEIPHLVYATRETSDISIINDLFKALKGLLFYWRIS